MAAYLKGLGLLLMGGVIGFVVRSVAPNEATKRQLVTETPSSSTGSKRSSSERLENDMLAFVLRGRKVRELDVDAVIDLLNQQREIAGSEESDPLEATAASFRVHLLATSLEQHQLEPVLDAVHKLTSEGYHHQFGHDSLEYSLLQRMIELDGVRARQWAIEHARKPLYAEILGDVDAEEAITFMSSEDAGENGWGRASVLAGIRAAERGVGEFLKVEPLIRDSDISDVLRALPASRCQEFAELFIERRDTTKGDSSNLIDVMRRWAIVDHVAATTWFWSQPSLENDEQIILGMLSNLLANASAAGLEFAERTFSKNESKARRWFIMMVNSGRSHETWPELSKRLPAGKEPSAESFSEHYRFGRAPEVGVMLATANCLQVAEEKEAYVLGVLNNVRGSLKWLEGVRPEEIATIVEGIEQLKLSDDVHGRVMEQFDLLLAPRGAACD